MTFFCASKLRKYDEKRWSHRQFSRGARNAKNSVLYRKLQCPKGFGNIAPVCENTLRNAKSSYLFHDFRAKSAGSRPNPFWDPKNLDFEAILGVRSGKMTVPEPPQKNDDFQKRFSSEKTSVEIALGAAKVFFGKFPEPKVPAWFGGRHEPYPPGMRF